MAWAGASALRSDRSAPIWRTGRRPDNCGCTSRWATPYDMRWYFAALGLLLVALIAAAAGIGWLVGTEAGLHWAAAKVRGLDVEGLHGKLAGEISAEKFAYNAEGFHVKAE